MRTPAERALLVLACLCMAGAAVGLYVQHAPKSGTAPVQQQSETTATQNAEQEVARETEEEPRRFPLPAGPRKYP